MIMHIQTRVLSVDHVDFFGPVQRNERTTVLSNNAHAQDPFFDRARVMLLCFELTVQHADGVDSFPLFLFLYDLCLAP